MVAERLFSLIGEDRMSEEAKTSEEAGRVSENERSHSVLPPGNDFKRDKLWRCSYDGI